MRQILCALIIIPSLMWAQENKAQEINVDSLGIQFERGKTWQQILSKSKEQNKYIFVDCYATWCVPCKKMEREVFPKKEVGEFINSHFISVRVQMDTSKTDDDNIKNWYTDAHAIRQQYKIFAFPTYLFFMPNGKIVHRYLNALPDSLFLKVAANAIDSDKQYYTLLENYSAGRKDYTKLNYLASISNQIGEESLANEIASDYLHNYVNTLDEKELHQKKYFDFASSFVSVVGTKDKIFKLLYKNGSRIDALMGQKDFAKNMVYSVITKEEINPRIWPGNKPISSAPDWNNISNSIRKKYNSYYTDLVVVDAQMKWYQLKKDRANQIKYTVKKIEKYGIDTAGVGWAVFNNVAYELFFKHCNNKDTLTKMIHWMEMVNKNHPDDYPNMDTYANLLYKVGRKVEAIRWEEKAAQLEEEAAKNEKRDADPSYKETLDKMKRGIPTWVKN